MHPSHVPNCGGTDQSRPFRGFLEIVLKCVYGLFELFGRCINQSQRKCRIWHRKVASIHESSGIRTHDRVSTP